MLTIKITNEEIANKIHESLVGYKPYVDSEIVLSKVDSEIVLSKDSGEYELIIGNENGNDFELTI